jgi:hypothetical protein
MEMAGVLLKDAWFLTAAVLFLAGLCVFLWSVAGLLPRRSPLSASVGRPFPPSSAPPVSSSNPKNLWKFPPPETPPVLPADMDSTVKFSSVAPPPAPAFSAPVAPSFSAAAPAVSTAAFDAQLAEIAKRLAALEHPKSAGQVPAYLEPLLKRVQDLEAELKNLKFGFTQLAAAQNAFDMNALNVKMQGLQKLLENLTGGTEVSKPS